MNQFYRALHMPPKRLLRKVMGEKEIYTIAVRPRPTAEGTEPLPALEGGPYTLLPRREGWWFADPLLYHRRGKRWLFAEAMDSPPARAVSRSASCTTTAPPTTGASRWKKISTCRSRWSLTGTVRSG